MTLLQRLKNRLQITNEDEDSQLNEILIDAKFLYATLRYPTSAPPLDDEGVPKVEPKYTRWVLRAAVEMYSKTGGEGQTAHTELGVHRVFDSGTVSQSLIREVTSYCGVAQ